MHGSIPIPMMPHSGSTFWADRNKIKKCLTFAFACGTLNMSQARANWKEENMWEARAEYADGTSIERLFEDNGLPDAEQQYRLEAWLIERKPDCTWYSVNWINN